MIIKEKNFINYETKKGIYKFDINTATLYGLRNKPIKNVPTDIKKMVEKARINGEIKITALNYFLDSIFDYNAGKINNSDFIPYYKLLDKIDSLNIPFYVYNLKDLQLTDKHFKKAIKIYNNENNDDSLINIVMNLEKEEIASQLPKALSEDKKLKDLICGWAINNQYTIEQCKIISSLILHNSHTFSMFKSIDDYTNELRYDRYNLARTFNYFFEMAELINYTINKKDSFTKQYFEIQEGVKIFRKSQDDDIYNSVYIKKPNTLNYCNDKFIIIIPKNKDDFIDESNQQHNCVFRTYYPKVRNNETYIVFVRKADSPTKSYITCEINKQGEIVQYLMKFNENIKSKEDIDFKNEYQKHLLENWKQRGATLSFFIQPRVSKEPRGISIFYQCQHFLLRIVLK